MRKNVLTTAQQYCQCHMHQRCFNCGLKIHSIDHLTDTHHLTRVSAVASGKLIPTWRSADR
jgi:hypothetical protein